MPPRKIADAGATIYDFVDEFLVVCPACSGRALVTASVGRRPPRLTCPGCGRAQDWKASAYGVLFSRPASGWPEGQFALGDAADAYFHLPLWLQSPCLGHTLWAFNERHLAFLREYVAATDRRVVRRRSEEPLNTLLASRLPRWIQLAKNRRVLLHAISKLEARALVIRSRR